MRRYMPMTLAAVFLTALSGCAPVISKGVLDTADRSITFAAILKDPAAYTGRTVVVGGVIIDAENLKDRTEILT